MPWRMFFKMINYMYLVKEWYVNGPIYVYHPKDCPQGQSPLWQQALAECAKLNEADVLKLYVGEKKYILV